jgi:hypothetical protein
VLILALGLALNLAALAAFVALVVHDRRGRP